MKTKKMKECVHMTWMTPFPPAKQGHNSRTEKVVKSKIEIAFVLWSMTLCINFK